MPLGGKEKGADYRVLQTGLAELKKHDRRLILGRHVQAGEEWRVSTDPEEEVWFLQDRDLWVKIRVLHYLFPAYN